MPSARQLCAGDGVLDVPRATQLRALRHRRGVTVRLLGCSPSAQRPKFLVTHRPLQSFLHVTQPITHGRTHSQSETHPGPAVRSGRPDRWKLPLVPANPSPQAGGGVANGQSGTVGVARELDNAPVAVEDHFNDSTVDSAHDARVTLATIRHAPWRVVLVVRHDDGVVDLKKRAEHLRERENAAKESQRERRRRHRQAAKESQRERRRRHRAGDTRDKPGTSWLSTPTPPGTRSVLIGSLRSRCADTLSTRRKVVLAAHVAARRCSIATQSNSP